MNNDVLSILDNSLTLNNFGTYAQFLREIGLKIFSNNVVSKEERSALAISIDGSVKYLKMLKTRLEEIKSEEEKERPSETKETSYEDKDKIL